jgi:hypothetical protein
MPMSGYLQSGSEKLQLFLEFRHRHVANIVRNSSFPSRLKLDDIIDQFVNCFVLCWITMATSIRQINPWASGWHVVGDFHLNILDVVRPTKCWSILWPAPCLSIRFVGYKGQELLGCNLQKLRSGEDVGLVKHLVVNEGHKLHEAGDILWFIGRKMPVSGSTTRKLFISDSWPVLLLLLLWRWWIGRGIVACLLLRLLFFVTTFKAYLGIAYSTSLLFFWHRVAANCVHRPVTVTALVGSRTAIGCRQAAAVATTTDSRHCQA